MLSLIDLFLCLLTHLFLFLIYLFDCLFNHYGLINYLSNFFVSYSCGTLLGRA